MTAWLTDTVLYTGAMIAAALVLRRPVARHFGAQVAYSLWALPFLRLLLPPIVLPASLAPQQAADVTTTIAVMPGAAAGYAPVAAAADPASPLPTLDMGQALLALWLVGAVLFLAWRVVSYRQMRRDVLKDARPVGEVGSIRLVETPAVAAPVAFGVHDKVIALPLFFMAQPDRGQRDLAIAHELAHHAGHDLLANFAAQAVLALHWCNPIAWYGWRAMRRDQEAACDARVLHGRGQEDRLRYAALIATFATVPRAPQFRALAAPMACPVLGEASIIHRLRSLSMSECSTRRRWFGRGLIAAGALALPLTASISYAAEEPAEAPQDAGKQRKRIVIVQRENGPDSGAPAFTHTVEQEDGTTVVLRTDRDLTDAEARERVAQALANLPAAPPAPPAPPAPDADGVAPPAPPAPPAVAAGPGEVRQFVLRREGGDGPRPEPRVVIRRQSGAAPFDEEALERDLEQMERDIERQVGDAAGQAQVHRFAFAGPGSGPRVNVVTRCDGQGAARGETNADGSRTVTICHAQVQATALEALKKARESVAGAAMPAEARAEALREIDTEIARMSR